MRNILVANFPVKFRERKMAKARRVYCYANKYYVYVNIYIFYKHRSCSQIHTLFCVIFRRLWWMLKARSVLLLLLDEHHPTMPWIRHQFNVTDEILNAHSLSTSNHCTVKSFVTFSWNFRSFPNRLSALWIDEHSDYVQQTVAKINTLELINF